MDSPVIIVGAGPAGLACAATLEAAGIDAAVLERWPSPGTSWRHHYARLHLHTHRDLSGLPGLAMDPGLPKYPARADVVAYLDAYAARLARAPEYGVDVRRITPAADGWRVETSAGTRTARAVIVASGMAAYPYRPDFPGLSGFPGAVLHSSAYHDPAPFAGQRVLVVGFGNSGGEIALDLADAGEQVAICVRGPVNILRRDVLGVPSQRITLQLMRLPYRTADAIARGVLKLVGVRVAELGMAPAAKGPIASIVEDARVPLLDVGTVERIQRGQIAVRPGIERIEGERVVFADGRVDSYDAIVLATGYRPDLRALLPESLDRLKPQGAPRESGAGGTDGLWFCGFRSTPTGVLREIGLEAQAIAADVAAMLNA